MRFIFILLILAPSVIFSQHLRGIEGTTQEVRVADYSSFFGVRATGMGGAHIALSDDYSATYYNPANLAFFSRIELSAALSNNSIKNDSQLNGIKSSRDLTKTRFDYVGGVIALPVVRGGASVAAGYNRVNSFDRVLFAQDTTRKALELSSGGLYAFTVSGGIQVAEGLGCGLTLDFYTGEENYGWDLEKYFHISDLQKLIISDNIKYKYNGVGLKLGLTYNPIHIIRASGVIFVPATIEIKETGTQRTDSIFTGREQYTETSNVVETYKLSLPYSFGAGIGLDLVYLVLGADVDYTDWRQVEYKEPSWILAENKYFSTSYRGVWRVRVGAEAIIPVVGVKVRAGFAHEPLPYIASKVEQDRYSITFGAGGLIAKLFAVDCALVFSSYSRVNTDSNLLEKYKFNRITLGLSYRF